MNPPLVFFTDKHWRRIVRSGMLKVSGAGPSMMVTSSSYLNTRCTFQRLRDARIVHGWVESFDEREIAVRASAQAEITEGEQFYFQVYGVEEDARFSATLLTKLNGTLGITEADKATSLCMFQIQGAIKTGQSAGNARLANQGMIAQVTREGVLISEHCDVLDVSPKGLAAPLPMQIEKGAVLELTVTTLLGEVQMTAVVRNSRPVEGGLFRHGLEIEHMHRIDGLRWSQVFKRSY